MFVKDYRLVDLYNASVLDFETYLQGWLIPAIAEFSICDQSLAYSSSSGSFTETLAVRNIVMLARIMSKYWVIKQASHRLQMNMHVQDKDFKVYSESQSAAEKRKQLSDLKEEISQGLVNCPLEST